MKNGNCETIYVGTHSHDFGLTWYFFLDRQQFGQIEDLRKQNIGAGGVGVIQHSGRFIYYLVTKKSSYQKPTYPDLIKSLDAMRDHMVSNPIANARHQHGWWGIYCHDSYIFYIIESFDREITVWKNWHCRGLVADWIAWIGTRLKRYCKMYSLRRTSRLSFTITSHRHNRYTMALLLDFFFNPTNCY